MIEIEDSNFRTAVYIQQERGFGFHVVKFHTIVCIVTFHFHMRGLYTSQLARICDSSQGFNRRNKFLTHLHIATSLQLGLQ